jgi:RsiW-degrading membrane proteinase PrsW (M82 family)
MASWKERWIYFVLGILFGIGFAVYKNYSPSLGLTIGMAIMSPLLLILGLGFSALSLEGYGGIRMESRSVAVFMGAGVPLGVILGSFL